MSVARVRGSGHRLRNLLIGVFLVATLVSSGTAGLYWRWSRAALPRSGPRLRGYHRGMNPGR